MKHAGKLKTALLAGMAAALVLGGSVGTSMSYFTTYVSARGSKQLHIERTLPTIEEQFQGSTKQVTVGNAEQNPCYVRVRVFAPVTCTVGGDGWSDGGDGYWYYSAVLQNQGDTANVLAVTPAIEGLTEDFNILVEVESAAIFYAADGTPEPNGPAYNGWQQPAPAGPETPNP